MDLIIENRLTDRLALGLIAYEQIRLRDAAALERFFIEELPRLRAAHERQLPPGYSFSRKLYRSCAIDPTRHRPSAEALWRRMRDHDDFPRRQPLIDLTNLLSLRFQVCYGLYDLDKIGGSIIAELGQPGDGYEGIGRPFVSLSGKILLRDEQGPFGNPSADSLRASVTDATTRLLQVLFFSAQDAQRKNILEETRSLFAMFFECNAIQFSWY